MTFKKHGYRVGSNENWVDDLPDAADLDKFIAQSRRHIEPWLSAVFQAEHLNLLVGSGLSVAVSYLAGVAGAGMGYTDLGTAHDAQIREHATKGAAAMGRGSPNIEDQIRSTLTLLDGLDLLGDAQAQDVRDKLDARLKTFLEAIFKMEAEIDGATDASWKSALSALQSFLLSFASRASSRERLHIFTTNYDRLVEYGCDLAGLRVIDRFVGALEPVFRSSRLNVDYHYNPPGIRGEPRFMEGVVRLSKVHGSVDWHLNSRTGRIHRRGISFGAKNAPAVPNHPIQTVMVYPNAAKDVETTAYPYAELFRDLAEGLCRPNAATVLYGYGFGDDHISRVLLDMLSLPSTHLVVFAYELDARLKKFLANTRPAQVSLLVGPHFASLLDMVEHYLPKPAIDQITGRMTELLKNRPHPPVPAPDPAGAGA